MRLRLAQLMQQDINLLILDEPTNHLDIESREVLEETIQQFEGTVVAVSHDRYFINQLFHRIAWLEAQQLFLYEGNYSWARQKHSERTTVQKVDRPSEEKQEKTISIEQQIEQLEQKIEKKKQQFTQTNNITYQKELEKLEHRLDELLTLWISE